MVITGHQHAYERLQLPDELAYVVTGKPESGSYPPNPPASTNSSVYLLNGLGGHNWIYEINGCDVHPGSRAKYNDAHGMLMGVLRYKDSLGKDMQNPYNAHMHSAKQMVDPASMHQQYRGGWTVREGHEEAEMTLCFMSTEDGGKLIDHVSVFG
jgi:hypothetical protein